MGLNQLGMGITFVAADLASGVIRQVAGSFLNLGNTATSISDTIAKKLGTSSKVIVGSLKGIAVGAALAIGGLVGLKASLSFADPAGKFEMALAGIKAISGATEEQLGQLERAAIDAGIATQFSPREAAEGLQILAQAGFDTKKSIDSLNPVLDLAAASLGQLGLEQAGGLAVASMKIFPKFAEDAGGAMDLLVRATSRSNLQFRDLPIALGNSARGVKVFNASLEDTLIALGEVRNVIPTIELGATSVATSMERLAMPRTQKMLKKLGVEVRTLDQKNFRPFLDVMTDVSKTFAAMGGQAERAEHLLKIFGRRGVAGLVPMLDALTLAAKKAGGGVADYDAGLRMLRESMRNTRISAESFRETLLDTFEGQKILLRGTLDTIAIAIGKPFTKVLKPIVAAVVQTLNVMLRMFLALPEPIKKFAAGFFVFASIALLVTGLAIAIKFLIPLIIAVGTTFAATLWPVLAIMAAVVAVAALVYAAWKTNFGGIRDIVLPIFEKISLAARSLFALFSSGEISGALAEDLGKAENQGVLGFVDGISRAIKVIEVLWEGMVEVLTEVWTDLSKEFAPVFEELAGAASEFGALFMEVLTPLAEALGLSAPGKDALGWIKWIGKAIFKYMLEPIKLMLKGLAMLVRSFVFIWRIVIAIARGFVAVLDSLGVLEHVLGPFVLLVKDLWDISSKIPGTWDEIGKAIDRVVEKIRGSMIARAALSVLTGGMSDAAFAVGDLRTASFRAGGGGAAGMAGVGSSSITASTGVVSQGTTAATIPTSTPIVSGGVSGADMRALVESNARLVETISSRPIVVQGEVVLDGEVVGEMQAQQDRDSMARGGGLSTVFGG